MLKEIGKKDDLSTTQKIQKSPESLSTDTGFILSGFRKATTDNKMINIERLAAEKKKLKKKQCNDTFPIGKPHFETNELFSRLEKAMIDLNDSEYHDALDVVAPKESVGKSLKLPQKKVPLIKGFNKVENSNKT